MFVCSQYHQVIFDLHQLPDEAQLELKNNLIQLIVSNKFSKVIVTQLCASLANLALQLFEWKTVIQDLVETLGSSPELVPSLLEFLKILPEEASTSRKLPISDEEYKQRTGELLVHNAENILELLLRFLNSDVAQAHRALIFHCFNSWLPEIHTEKIICSPLLDLIFTALQNDDTFEPAVECLCHIIHDTRNISANMASIQVLYPRVIFLRLQIAKCKDDPDAHSGYSKIFTEAGESWSDLIVQQYEIFRDLVESIAECTAIDEDLDVVKYTFPFWFELKELLTSGSFEAARKHLSDIYLKLIDIVIDHLAYPTGNGSDFFDGDREEEEKFRDFRHEIGDLLKDCCSVVGTSKALSKVYSRIVDRLQVQAAGKEVSWQSIEAPLFSMRAMAREVDLRENEVVPKIMELLVQLPEHEKIRYAVTLVLGRYTLWTAKHPEFLETQLSYITNGFEGANKEVIGAAAQALKYFCEDCGPLLTNYASQLYPFYEKVSGSLDLNSYYEVTRGIAHVVKAQPIESIFSSLQHFATPICQGLVEKSSQPGNEQLYKDIADQFETLNIFVEVVDVKTPEITDHPVVKFVSDLLPLVQTLLDKHGSSVYVAEKCSKFIRHSVYSCRTSLVAQLPTIAELLAREFQKTHFGCYLWVTGSIVNTFSTGQVDDSMKNSVWEFAQVQSTAFFAYLSAVSSRNEPDLVDDFFRLMDDVLRNFPSELITSDLLAPSFEAALVGLDMPEYNPVISSLYFLSDLFLYGADSLPSKFKLAGPEVKQTVLNFLASHGDSLVFKLIENIIYSFPRDALDEAESLLNDLCQLVPAETAVRWIQNSVKKLQGLGLPETFKFMKEVTSSLNAKDYDLLKSVVGDFTERYTRRNLAARRTMRADSNN